jgi:hypothetical protein
VPRK